METLKFTVTVVAILVLTISFTWWVAQEHFRNSVLDMRAKMFAAETQLKIEIENSKIKLDLKNGIINDQDDKLRALNIELPRKFAHIEQLCRETKVKDDEIFLLKEEKKQIQDKLDHYRPMQGPGGKFIRKAIPTN